ncbi:hypothetical protein [Rufibacter hautae]|uniref:Lipoprotein n=1 Tax=Rufibacter hautae TaxID=2595005 RepID=A0A5B6TBS6_9BACT|nr:hypothetical protein [Rufibacter hautae]KAA3437929.1 hypothetical protein FOA19_11640 [Rufibacter hautae]
MKIIGAILLLGLSSCISPKPGVWQTMDLGEFTITVPKGSKVQPQESVDSYRAKIIGDGFEFTFEYGAYSPKLTLSPEEYIQLEEWHMDESFGPLFSILKPSPTLESVVKKDDSTYLATYKARECINSDSCSLNIDRDLYRRYFAIKDSTLEYEFRLPKELLQHDFTVSTTDSTFKRVFIPNELDKHDAGVYMINRNSCIEDNEYHCWKQLALFTSGTVKISRSELKEILNSLTLK